MEASEISVRTVRALERIIIILINSYCLFNVYHVPGNMLNSLCQRVPILPMIKVRLSKDS